MTTNPTLLISGFGAFEKIAENPSGRLARSLASDPPAGVSLHAVEMEVSFRGVGVDLENGLAELAPLRPRALICLGVQKEATFRLERKARARLTGERPDNLGCCAIDLALPEAPDLETAFDLEELAGVLRAAGAASTEISEDAGGYVCERTYRCALELGQQLGVPALFLHVPPLGLVPFEQQLAVVRALLSALGARLR